MFEGSQASSTCVLVTAPLRRISVGNIGEITLIDVKIDVIGKHPVPLKHLITYNSVNTTQNVNYVYSDMFRLA
jgi:hypothetical protein